MFFKELLNLTTLKIQKNNVKINNEIIHIKTNNFIDNENTLNIIDGNSFNKLKDVKGNYLIYNCNKEISLNQNINYIVTNLDNCYEIVDIVNECLYKHNNFLFLVYDIIANNRGIDELLKIFKKEYNSNVCILSNNKKLVYNIFDFNKVNDIFSLKISKKASSRVFGYLAFENVDEKLHDSIDKVSGITSIYIYTCINEFINSKDKFYDTLKNLSLNNFTDEDAQILKIINWNINDQYKLYNLKLEGGLFKYRDMFVHGNKFILDYPMYLYSIIVNNNLLILLNESNLNSDKIKTNIQNYIDKYNLDYSTIYLRKNLLNFYKAYELTKYIIDNNLNIKENIDLNLDKLIFSMSLSNDFIEMAIPEEVIALKNYDKDKNSELLKTLYYYLIEERSLIKASKQMDVHRNSIVYRINKVNELVDIDLEKSTSRQNILIALEILDKLNPGLIK
ncbi:helix-turn-helix domain-containing protein [Miniphocaeibacter halophilus]|uniref:Helix-turn-helix domain-containing protein n=1 Tax=Miniphocaeibacter halophilus TaxID=2931922 RepID=A0AC61MSW0_9FIRM|nr:helix-turn-helix domain-containing protein [Miniphocaeibacter halophilus]QQK07531.1 helix-turn-helix domain-containing protein [Miniphocaeibacter halophilus]